ncbi:hypothetical protein HKD37_04G010614 [Glycine soja]
MRLPRRAVLLDEGSGDRRSDYLTGGDRNSVGLAEACDQSQKPQGPNGLLRVQRVPSRHHTCKQINGIREVRVVVTRQDIAEQQRHPYLGQGSHAGVHDPYPPPCNSLGKILPRYAQQLGDGFLIETVCLAPPMAELTLLVFLQNQRVAQELAEGICVKGNPLTPHP